MAGRPRTRRNALLGIVCGAHARSTGKPCQAKLLLRGGRCKLHGGKSTGAKTPEGKVRSKQALITYWDKRR
jgi:hypothetical protein